MNKKRLLQLDINVIKIGGKFFNPGLVRINETRMPVSGISNPTKFNRGLPVGFVINFKPATGKICMDQITAILGSFKRRSRSYTVMKENSNSDPLGSLMCLQRL